MADPASHGGDDAWLAEPDGLLGPPGAPADHVVGDWSFRSDAADIRYVRIGGREVVRRLFVTVRDASWREIAPVAWSSEVDDSGDVWRIRLAARYSDGDLELAWRGVFAIDPATGDASIRVAGLAGTDLSVNRVSLVALHPIEELIGGSIETDGPNGAGSVDVTAALLPQVKVNGLPSGLTPPFDHLVTRFADGTAVDFALSGQLFEIEDQRNFGDSSLKTYGPPLAGGFPYPIAAGSRFEHAIRWTAALAADRPAPVTRVSGALPELSIGERPAEPEAGRTTIEDYFVELNRGIPLEIADDAGGDIDVLVSPAVHSGDPLTIAENVTTVREILDTLAERAPGRGRSVSLTLRQGPPPPLEGVRLGLPWAVAVVGALAGSGATAVTLRDDLLVDPDGVLSVLRTAVASGDVTTESDLHARVHRIAWSGDGGTQEVIVNLGLSAVDAPGARVIWPASASTFTGTVPAGAIGLTGNGA